MSCSNKLLHGRLTKALLESLALRYASRFYFSPWLWMAKLMNAEYHIGNKDMSN